MPDDDPPPRARVCLLCTCGLPGSGKSTLARGIAERALASGDVSRVHVVTFDDVERDARVDAVAAGTIVDAHGFDAKVWRDSRRTAFARIDAHLLAAGIDDTHPSTDEHRHHHRELIIADDNFYYASMRYQAHQLARHRGAAHVQLYADVAPELAYARNAAREPSERVPRAAFDRMANALEPPDRHKRSWEDATVVTSTMGKALEEDADGSTDAVSSMWSSVWRAWGTAPPPPMTAQERTAVRDAGRAANATSAIHALDLRSRRALGECVRRCDAAARADASAALNAARKEMLDAAREKTAGPRGGVTSEGGDETDAVLDEDALELAAFVMQREDAFAQLCEDFAPVAVDAGDDGT